MRILVTGGAGLIGHKLVKKLLQKGYETRVLDIRKGALEEETSQNLEFVLGSVENKRTSEEAIEDVDVVYHLAIQHLKENYDFFNANMRGAFNLLETARNNGVKQFIFSSSTAVYARPMHLPIDEVHQCNPEEVCAGPGILYGLMKLTIEKLCMLYYYQFELPVTIFRISLVYGGRNHVNWLERMVEKALRGEKIRTVKGVGSEYIHVDEVVQAFLLAMLNPKAYGQVFNLSNPKTFLTGFEMAQLIVQSTNSKSMIEEAHDPKAYPTRYSIDKLKRVLGFEVKTGKEDVTEFIKEYASS